MAASAPRPDSTKDLNIGTLMARFRCEDRCRDYLEQLRWPEGVRCPRCESAKAFPLKGRNQYECGNEECGYQFSVTAGTKIQDSKLPLWKWFLAVYLMIHAKKGISAKQLQSMLGGSYKTSWFLCHRIRAAMVDVDSPKLTGTVEVDETFMGGRATQSEKYENKTIVMAAIQRDAGRVKLAVVPDRRARTMQRFVKNTVAGDAEAIYTDKHSGYKGLGDHDTKHKTIKHAPEYDRETNKVRTEWVNGKVHTNTVEGVFSLLKRAIIGSYHKVGKQHLQSYLDEVAFKYNNRRNPYLFRDTLVALIGSEALTYQDLVG